MPYYIEPTTAYHYCLLLLEMEGFIIHVLQSFHTALIFLIHADAHHPYPFHQAISSQPTINNQQ
jgi:hypothetical protein